MTHFTWVTNFIEVYVKTHFESPKLSIWLCSNQWARLSIHISPNKLFDKFWVCDQIPATHFLRTLPRPVSTNSRQAKVHHNLVTTMDFLAPIATLSTAQRSLWGTCGRTLAFWLPILKSKVRCHTINVGDLAQMVERSLSMWEARGSIPRFSIIFIFLIYLIQINPQLSINLSGRLKQN